MRLLKKITFILVFVAVLWACRKPTVASWDVDVVLPVVTSQLNIKNFLGDSIFKSDNTGLLNLAVTRTITAIKIDSLLKLPDTTIVSSFTLPVFNATLQPGEVLPFTPSSPLTFSIGNGVALKKVDIRSGTLNVKFSNDLAEPIDMFYVVTSATKNGEQFAIKETVPPGINSLIKSYDLAGLSLNMTGSNGTTYNTIIQTYTVKVNANATGPATVSFGKGAKAEITYKDIVPDYVEGYFGQQDVSIPLDSTKLEILKSFEAPNFMLSDANFSFNILNEFGAEFSASLFNIKSINGNSAVALNTSQLSNINVNRATKVARTVYPSAKVISLTKTNSNIVNFLSNLPDKLTYQGNITVNPLGNISGYNDFAFYNTGIKVLADINIPLRFSADYFKLVSNTKIDFANVSELDNVNSGKFVISASNGYPFSAKLQAYLQDANGNTIDSLFINGSNILQKGVIDNQNIVLQPTKSKIEMPLDKDKIANLKKSKSVKIISYFIMPPNPPDIKIYENYVFDLNIVAELNYRAERK